MKTIYLDSDFRCHLTNDGTMTAIETDAFDGKANAYIEGYRYIPEGQTWTRSDGVIFQGLMISPAENYSSLKKAQEQYELDEARRLNNLNIPQEMEFTATRNYSIGNFLAIYGELYEVISPIAQYVSIIPEQNVIKTTVEHYLDTLKEEE